MDYLGERLEKAARELSETVGTLYYEMPFEPQRTDCEAVLVFADWHYGMTTDNPWNHFDVETCKARVRSVTKAAVARLGTHGVRKLHVVALGDLCHGGLLASARVASEELVADQLMQVSEVLAQSIEVLANYVDEVEVHVTYGNHMRTIQTKKDSVHRDNMERIIPWWLRWRMAQHDNIIVCEESEDELLFFEVCGYGFCATHGDLDVLRRSPTMFATMMQRRYGKRVDCVLLADKHHREEIEELGVQAMICGSLCGTDDYANGRRLYSTPEQLMLIVNPEVGIDATYHLRCACN